MAITTKLEDLSNEIFLEILDYLDATDILFAFTSLNSRISLILNSTRLHLNIRWTSYRYQVQFLSHHLKCYSSQVVSLEVYNEICDQENVIAYLFNRHDFLNLRSCIFHLVNLSSRFKIVFEKFSKLKKIVLFRIIQTYRDEKVELNSSYAHNFSQLILVDTPSTIRSANLLFNCNHSQIRTNSIVPTNLTRLEMIFSGTLNDISIYSLIPLLRIHVALRSLCVTIKSTEVPMRSSINVPSLPLIDENDLPTSSLLKSFDFQIIMVRCDIDSIGLILRCMPNLHRFVFTLIVDQNISPFIMNLINGQNWHQMLKSHLSYLNKFDFYISLLTNGESIDLDGILNSFNCFLVLYHQWDICITRWRYRPIDRSEHIHLWTVNYNNLRRKHEYDIPTIAISDTFDMRSTNLSNLNNQHCHSHHNVMNYFMTTDTRTSTLQLNNIPFQNVNFIVCHLGYPLPVVLSFLVNIVIRLKRIPLLWNKNEDDSQKYLDNLSLLVNLSNIDTVQFSRNNDIARLHVIKHVLLACPNITTLIIDSSLLFSSEVFNNPALTSIFNRLNTVRIWPDDMYFPLKYALKFVQRFSSLTTVQIEVYSIDTSVPIVDIFLSGLAKLCFIVIDFEHDTLLDDPFPRHYIIDKRRQSFHLNKNDEDKIIVKIENRTLYIRVA